MKRNKMIIYSPFDRIKKSDMFRQERNLRCYLIKAITLFILIGVLFGYSLQGSQKAHAASFSVDQNFIANVENAAKKQTKQTEYGYIPQNDCTHFISKFLEDTYNLQIPRTINASWTDDLINYLIADGDASVITGDKNYDSGAFVDAGQANSYFSSLDQNLVENGGTNEYLIAYKWSTPTSHALADHLTVYVGNNQVVGHGVQLADGSEYAATPKRWDKFDNLIPGGSIAIIALTNGRVKTNEAGHVMAATGNNVVLDSNGNRILARCNGINLNGNAVLPKGFDVVVLDDSKSYQLNGRTYVYAALPDWCEPNLDFSDPSAIADGSGEVGYVPLDALSEIHSVQPAVSDADWRDCWIPTTNGCQDASYSGGPLQSKDANLYAWWDGSNWQPRWWHVIDGNGQDAVVYGRDWMKAS